MRDLNLSVPPSVHPHKTGSENEDVSGSLARSLASLAFLPLVASPVRPLSVRCRNVAVTTAIVVVFPFPLSLSL